MRVTFVYPDFFAYDDEHFMTEGRIYLGIGYLSAYLKREGHETSLLHLVRPASEEEFKERLAASRPGLVAFSSTTHLFPHVRKWAGWAGELLPGTPTVCGGAHATIDPEGALLSSSLDLVCLGEGEEALAELCAALEEGRDHRRIPSLWARDGEGIIRNPVRPLVEDLDSLPFPDRDIFDPADFCEQQHERGTLMASRGCPYNCSYCSNHVQKGVYPNPEKYVRFRSVDNVMREVHEIIAADTGRRLKYIRFDDDILTIDKEWFRELAGRYREEVGLPFICNSRANLLDEETARLFAGAGCSVICMGIESGNRRIRREVLNRPMPEERIVGAFRLCRDHGIKTVSTNMTALPGEGVRELLDTVKLNARARPDCMQVSTFHPYPHTRLYERCREEGLLSGRHVDTIFDGRSALDAPAFSAPAFRAVQGGFYPLAELYSRAYGLGRAGRPLERGLDWLIASERVPWRFREAALKPLLKWGEKHQRFEWIYY
jgi:anaerobic magnesium-protoporphyrin IX monomethyl ester cyclase